MYNNLGRWEVGSIGGIARYNSNKRVLRKLSYALLGESIQENCQGPLSDIFTSIGHPKESPSKMELQKQTQPNFTK